MNRRKKLMAGLLTAAMLASMLPMATLAVEDQGVDPPIGDESVESGIAPNSLLPLNEYEARLDLTGYFLEELKAVPASEVLENLEYIGDTYTIQPDAEIAWATGRYNDIDDDFTIITDWETDTIDLSPEYYYDTEVTLELVVGTADQLNPQNVRIIVDVAITAPRDLLDFTIYTNDAPRTEVEVFSTYFSERNSVYQIGVDSEDWKSGQAVYLSMKLSSEFDSEDLTAAVYDGLHSTEADAIAAVQVNDIWDQHDLADSGGHLADYSYKPGYEGMPEFTVVLKRDGTTVCVLPLIIYMYGDSMSLQGNRLYAEENDRRVLVSSSWDYENDDYDTRVFTLDPGYDVNGTYYFGLELYNPDPNAENGGQNGINFVQKAVKGYFETLEVAEDEDDIKNALFSDPDNVDGGYGTDYSGGVTFTVFTTTNQVLHYTLRTEAGEEEATLPAAPTPLSRDTYFRMESALKEPNGDEYDAYVMPYEDDSYYYNGYQTVFLLENNGSGIADGTSIYPEFFRGSSVDVFAGLDIDGQTASAQIQNSGESSVTFQNGEAIQYSAAAENGSHLKNYWVTFVTKQTGGPALFVNGTNYEGHYDAETGLPVREVFLTKEYDYHHDIFFANIGDQQMTGLTVTLSEDAQNVKLDEYWDIDEVKTLAPFSSTDDSTTDYGELSNVAKIRLVSATDENGNPLSGEISGTLTISADGIEPVEIILKGTAGIPEITTESILDGVLYVPYSSVIQTNNMYDADAIVFTLESGRLPAGVSLLENGEIYGVPRESGSFTFTVSATYEGTEMEAKEFTLEITSNTDEAVWNYDQTVWSDETYQISVAIPNEDGSVSAPGGTWNTENNSWNNSEQIFETEGEYAYFEDVWLDGQRLTFGTDYTAEEGSTRITIRTQTLERNGSGTHTIAAEFRDGSDNLRRAAQNYEITSSTGSGSGNAGGGSSSSNSSSSNNSEPSSYRVSVEQTTGGTIASNQTSASRGDTVTITVMPDENYELDSLIVTDQNGNRITTSNAGGNRYTFTMPARSVTIHATFARLPDPVPGLPFIDVRVNDWFVPYVTYVYERGLMVGTSANTFEPYTTTSRGMIVVMMHNLAGYPPTDGTYFSDVPLNQFYTEAASWAAENGIVSGYGNGSFGPDDPITREQMVMILMRYATYQGLDVSRRANLSQFTDSAMISESAIEAVSWACAEGMLSGSGDNSLNPNGQATRAEVAAIFTRFCQMIEDSENN